MSEKKHNFVRFFYYVLKDNLLHDEKRWIWVLIAQ